MPTGFKGSPGTFLYLLTQAVHYDSLVVRPFPPEDPQLMISKRLAIFGVVTLACAAGTTTSAFSASAAGSGALAPVPTIGLTAKKATPTDPSDVAISDAI